MKFVCSINSSNCTTTSATQNNTTAQHSVRRGEGHTSTEHSTAEGESSQWRGPSQSRPVPALLALEWLDEEMK